MSMPNLSINHKDVALGIDKDIARNKIPYFIRSIRETPFLGVFLKTESCHIGVNHHLSGWMSISNSWLNNNWLDGTTIEACKGLHLLGYLEVALHVLRKVARVHRRLLRCGYFPHLALRYLLVELVEICHDSSLLRISQGQRYDNLMKQTNILQKKN